MSASDATPMETNSDRRWWGLGQVQNAIGVTASKIGILDKEGAGGGKYIAREEGGGDMHSSCFASCWQQKWAAAAAAATERALLTSAAKLCRTRADLTPVDIVTDTSPRMSYEVSRTSVRQFITARAAALVSNACRILASFSSFRVAAACHISFLDATESATILRAKMSAATTGNRDAE